LASAVDDPIAVSRRCKRSILQLRPQARQIALRRWLDVNDRKVSKHRLCIQRAPDDYLAGDRFLDASTRVMAPDFLSLAIIRRLA